MRGSLDTSIITGGASNALVKEKALTSCPAVDKDTPSDAAILSRTPTMTNWDVLTTKLMIPNRYIRQAFCIVTSLFSKNTTSSVYMISLFFSIEFSGI